MSTGLFDYKHQKSQLRPDIRNSRNFEHSIKNAIATVSYRAAISVPKARVAVQATCENFYNYRYYLSSGEQQKFEPLAVIEELDETITSIDENDDSLNTTSEPPNKKARSKNAYIQNYKYVLPSRRVVADFKHKKALQQEIAAAKALCNKKADTKVTLHFDTSRSRVDGEWLSLILNFKSDTPEDIKCLCCEPSFCIRGS